MGLSNGGPECIQQLPIARLLSWSAVHAKLDDALEERLVVRFRWFPRVLLFFGCSSRAYDQMVYTPDEEHIAYDRLSPPAVGGVHRVLVDGMQELQADSLLPLGVAHMIRGEKLSDRCEILLSSAGSFRSESHSRLSRSFFLRLVVLHALM
jgi:hypothetical protein